jgi:uncharacterized membrane protein YtjA (UPF0391 family)
VALKLLIKHLSVEFEIKYGGIFMLRAAIAFFVLAIVAFILGASGIAGVSMEIGKLLLTVFLVLAVISFVIDLVSRRGSR